jgi:hypothetical protein
VFREDFTGSLVFPSANLSAALADAARHHQHDGNGPLPLAGVLFVDEVELFADYEFQVDSREVPVPGTCERVMRHRARLDEWQLYVELEFDESVLDPKLVRALVDDAGSKVGLGEDTPAAGGTFGRFVVTAWEGGGDDDDGDDEDGDDDDGV